MQIKNNLAQSDQEELKQDLHKPGGLQLSGFGDISKNIPEHTEGEEKVKEEESKVIIASKTSKHITYISKRDMNGTGTKKEPALRKSPEDPRCQKKVLKIATKQRVITRNNKSAGNSTTKVSAMERKKKKSQLTSQSTGSQLLPTMHKAGFESTKPELPEETKPESSILKKMLFSEGSPPSVRKLEAPRGTGPFFYIGGGNGAHLISAYCVRKGWQRIQDSKREDYILKWCELKSSATYCPFREGEQLVYQIPNNKLLTSKIGLLNSLREYERVMQKMNKSLNHRLLKMDDFFPETFRLDLHGDTETFFSLYKEGQIWICKPTGLNQGRGIFLLKTPEEINTLRFQLQAFIHDSMLRKIPTKCQQARIVQRYIQNPLLLDGRKFDVRSYLLIASTVPYVVFFRHGYVRLTCNSYDPKSDDLTGHLTNQYMQKKNPLYSELKEETVWGMDRFNNYVNENVASSKGLPQDWVLNTFTKRMQQIMMHCFLAVKSKLECRVGYFDLIGCDFLIDQDFKVWILEMNCNPALHTNCEVLKDIIPNVVNETLDLTIEIFNKTQRSQRILPINTQSRCVLLYYGGQVDQAVKFNRPKPTISPFKMQKTLPLESLPHFLKNKEKKGKKVKAACDNGNGNEAKAATSKVTQKSTMAMPPVHLDNIPNGKCKTISEPCEKVIQGNNVIRIAEGKMEKNTPVVEMSTQDPQVFMIKERLDVPRVIIDTSNIEAQF